MCRRVASPVLRVRALGYRERVWAIGSHWRALCEFRLRLGRAKAPFFFLASKDCLGSHAEFKWTYYSSLRRLQDHPRALAQRQPSAWVVLDRRVKVVRLAASAAGLGNWQGVPVILVTLP
jgi:hypothetical protein